MKAALQDRTLLHPANGTNLAGQHLMGYGNVAEAFKNADYTRKEKFKIHRHTGNPLETRGLLASYKPSSGQLNVWWPTKVPHFNRATQANHLEIPEENIHFIKPDVGSGFGIKGEFYPEDFLIPFASMKLGRPVKWSEDRLEHLMSATTPGKWSAPWSWRRNRMEPS